MEELTEYIYKLDDPRTDKVRYVGRTNNPNKRFYLHLAANSGNVGKDAWIIELDELGLQPIMTVIEIVRSTNRYNPKAETSTQREKYWIRHYLEQGAPLFNCPIKEARKAPIIFDIKRENTLGPLEKQIIRLEGEVSRLKEENTHLRGIINQIAVISNTADETA